MERNYKKNIKRRAVRVPAGSFFLIWSCCPLRVSLLEGGRQFIKYQPTQVKHW